MNIHVDVMQGTIKWFDSTKGYGFIVDKDGNDVFFHRSQVQDVLIEGVNVYYETFETQNGLRARNVQILLQNDADNETIALAAAAAKNLQASNNDPANTKELESAE